MKEQDNFIKNRFAIYENLIKKHFNFLKIEYDFKIETVEIVEGQYVYIEYISKSVFITFCYGVPDLDLSFNFGRIGIEDKQSEPQFSASDLLYLDCCKELTGNYLYSAHSYENLCIGVKKLSFLLKKCGVKILKGIDTEYEEIIRLQKKALKDYHLSQKLIQLRAKANKAWINKEYSEVVTLYESMGSYLESSEIKKIDYAKKHIKK